MTGPLLIPQLHPNQVGAKPHLIKIPEGMTHCVCFIWAPLFSKSENEADLQIAELGGAETPEEFYRVMQGLDTSSSFPVTKVIKLQSPKK